MYTYVSVSREYIIGHECVYVYIHACMYRSGKYQIKTYQDIGKYNLQDLQAFEHMNVYEGPDYTGGHVFMYIYIYVYTDQIRSKVTGCIHLNMIT